MLDDVAADAHLSRKLYGGTIALTCVIIRNNRRYVML